MQKNKLNGAHPSQQNREVSAPDEISYAQSDVEAGTLKGVKQNLSENYWRKAFLQMRKVHCLAGAGMLSALGLVLKMLTISVGTILKIGFAFLATALSGYLYGPVVAGFMGAILDILGFLFNPTGPYFFGFTLSAFFAGFIYGLFLWQKPIKLLRVFIACFCVMIVVSFLLNPMWLSILYGDAWLPMVAIRLPANLAQLPINTMLLFFMLKLAAKTKKLQPN